MRPKLSIYDRVSRHTGLSEATLRDGNDECWFWNGAFHPKTARSTPSRHKLRTGPVKRKPRPQLEGIGHPVRGLLGIQDRYVRIQNQCGNDACVNPAHFGAKPIRSVKEGRVGRMPSQFSEYEEAMIGLIADELDQGYTPDPNFYAKALINEAFHRRR